MALLERIEAQRVIEGVLAELSIGPLPHCMYCGSWSCEHALAWRSRVWSSECAAMHTVLPEYVHDDGPASVVQAIADGAYRVTI